MMMNPGWVIQHIIPPALLSYFAWAWKRCTWTIGKDYLYVALGRPWLAAAYIVALHILLPSITIVFLRLYFLPKSQSVPPPLPPVDIASLDTLFECTPPRAALDDGYALIPHAARDDPLEADSLLLHCDRGRCGGRWKPARARHCSECGLCRAAFDHHCAFFANCLTAPFLPAFLALCYMTPVTVAILTSPTYVPLFWRALAAWKESSLAPQALQWWAWKWSWVVPCGPVGRWAVGLALGWRSLDAADAGGPSRLLILEMGIFTFIGNLLAIITFFLGWTTTSHIRSGRLTIDFERVRAYSRARGEADRLIAKDIVLPPALADRLARFGAMHWFFVPTEDEVYAGVVLRSLPDEKPYDLDDNFDATVSRGRGFRWILPWNAIKPSKSQADILNWPIAPAVHTRLAAEAAERVATASILDDDDEVSAPRRPGADRLAYTRL